MSDELYSVPTGETPVVKVEVNGDLRVEGWDKLEVAAQGDDDDVLSVEAGDEVIEIKCRSDLRLWLPRAADLELTNARGDAVVGSLTGPLTIGDVAGDLALRGVGATTVSRVSGDLSVRDVHGDLMLGMVAADASVRNVVGRLAAEAIGSDLYLRGVRLGFEAMAGADASISLLPQADEIYRLKAGSDIRCRLAEESNARIEVQSGSQSLRVDLDDVEVDDQGGGRYVLVVGEGGPTISLLAGGSVAIVTQSSEGVDVGDIGEQFASEFGSMADGIALQVEASTEAALSQVSEHLASLSETLPEVLESAGIAGAEADRIAEKVRLSSENVAARAAERAVSRAERTARRAERKAAKAQRRAERQSRHEEGRGPRRSSRRTVAPAEPVSDAEREAVLRMLEEGSISVEQAESLLRALGGNR